ncbi:hypothetical protein IKO70_07175 [bacterium]|nr:hypothetical protein [bacterium]MBR6245466.1 hypothetical protein [bacterium]
MKFSVLLSVLFICLFFAACGSEKGGSDLQEAEDADYQETDDSSDDESDPGQDFPEDKEPVQNDEDSIQIDEDLTEPDNDEPESALDLSGSETANCYIVKTAGNYSFDATIRGNGRKIKGVDFTDEKLKPADVRLLWQSDKRGLIDSLQLKEGRIYFSSKGKNGNALIAALDEAGNIIWSWHIWLLNEEISDVRTADGVMVMDRNLGAVSLDFESPESHGMLYQWGRHEPFPASPVVSGGTTSTMPVPVYDADGNEVAITASSRDSTENNTLEYALSHPATVLSNNAQFADCRDWLRKEFSNPELWGGSDGEKSLFDPCPAGYRVPKLGTFDFFTSSGGYETDIAGFSVFDISSDGVIDGNDYKNGWYILLDAASDSYSYFPAAARYDGSYAMLMGSKAGLWGNYWYADADDAVDSSVPCGAYALAFQSGEEVSASPKAVGARADGYSVRCVRE